MQRGDTGEIPLPTGWEEFMDFDGKVFYIDHKSRQTTWINPRDRVTKPHSFADCIGDELPVGWEECYDPPVGVYYINHFNQTNQLEDPRQQWRQEQEHMLKEYLVTAQEDLDAKKEIYNVKEQRLVLAQDEYQHLTDTLTGWTSSRTSLNSNSSLGSSKYDPDLLKADVALAKNRVSRLRRELEQIHAEMEYKERGVETLSQVDKKLSNLSGGYNITQAQEILHNIQKNKQSLQFGERERRDLMQSLAKLKDDFLMNKNGGSSPDVSTLSLLQEKSTTASQTELRGELGSSGPCLAEMARLRLSYGDARSRISFLKDQLAKIEDEMIPGQVDSDKDRLILIQEKEQLLRELRGIDPKGRTEEDMGSVRAKIAQLENDLTHAFQISNKQIAERLKLQEEKTNVMQKLSDTTRRTTLIEAQLKSLSMSTLSMSSGSSLGSLGSLSASSRGSLTSLGITDIYGSPHHTDVNIRDLHQRVEKLLQGHSITPINELKPASTPTVVTNAAVGMYLQSVIASTDSHSMQSLSPHSSLSSLSPPVSPYEVGPPPSYEQHIERHRRVGLNGVSYNHNGNVASGAPPNVSLDHMRFTMDNASQHQRLDYMRPNMPQMVPQLPQLMEDIETHASSSVTTATTTSNNNNNNVRTRSRDDAVSNPPLSPISETSSGVCNNLSGGNTRSVSAAVSDESVAGDIDSGVFEVSVKRPGDLEESLEMNIESAQIQIKFKYESLEKRLHIGLEQARNIGALSFPEGSKVCVKCKLLPVMSWTWQTHALQDLKNPKFNKVFMATIPEQQLYNKTLQVQLWSMHEHKGDECMGCTLVSLADFNLTTGNIYTRWYNVLSFKLMLSDLKENDRKLVPPQNSPVALPNNSTPTPVADNDLVIKLLEGTSAKLQPGSTASTEKPPPSDTPREASGFRRSHPNVSSMKGDSSDESTIISSQTSTLTRNQGPEAMECHRGDTLTTEMDDCDEDDDEDDDDENLTDYNEQNLTEGSDEVLNGRHMDESDSATSEECLLERVTCDKQTNTDANYKLKESRRQSQELDRNSRVKRSQTFSPSGHHVNNYLCKLNRSDSDSSMPLYKRGPFQRNSMERRSLRHKRLPGSAAAPVKPVSKLPVRTSLDLELDLKASETRLSHLSDEIARLKELKRRMEEAKHKGETELPEWLTDDEQFQKLLAEADRLLKKKSQGNTMSKQDRHAEQLLRKVTHDVKKMRMNRQQSKAMSFREKMSFITTINMTVPVLPRDVDDRIGELLQDNRVGEEV